MPGSLEKLAGVANHEEASVAAEVEARTGEARSFSLWERVQISFVTWAGYLAVWFFGRSLRWEVIGRENYEAAVRLGKSFIVTFWHCEIFSAIWYWRQRGMVVMVSQNFDGEYIARIIKKHGYNVARGSSSRSASRVLVEMIRALRKGLEAAVTPDGPRGPRHVAKPGVVLLSKATGAAILCFHIVPERAWVLGKSWDRTEVPKPFCRTAIFIAPSILVAANASEEEQACKLQQVQATLDDLVKQGEAWKSESRAAHDDR